MKICDKCGKSGIKYTVRTITIPSKIVLEPVSVDLCSYCIKKLWDFIEKKVEK